MSQLKLVFHVVTPILILCTQVINISQNASSKSNHVSVVRGDDFHTESEKSTSSNNSKAFISVIYQQLMDAVCINSHTLYIKTVGLSGNDLPQTVPVASK